MGLTIHGDKKIPRNEACPCGSELKYKLCHGDQKKRAIAQKAANMVMLHLIMEEKYKKGKITEEEWRDYLSEPLPERIEYAIVGTETKPKIILED